MRLDNASALVRARSRRATFFKVIQQESDVMWSRSKKARREAALAAAVQILKCKAELDNLKAELDKLRRPKNDEGRLDDLDRAWHVMMDAIQRSEDHTSELQSRR